MRCGWLVWIFVVAGACAERGEREQPAGVGGLSQGGSLARSGSSNGATAGWVEGCPDMGTIPGPVDPCGGCNKLACEPGQKCQGSFHRGNNAASYCTCVEGEMNCCVTVGSDTACSHGDRPLPECPAGAPKAEEPCGPVLQVCRYSAGCNQPAVTAFCNGQSWQLSQQEALPIAGAAGAACTSGAANGDGGAGGAP